MTSPKEKADGSECKLQGHKGGWDKDGNAYCTTCDESAPNEQVISPDIDKKEISGDMDNCVCDETHIHNCPVHTHLQDEPEVKAQGLTFEEYWDKSGLENEWRDTWSKLNFEECFLAGQKSKAATLKLPEKDIFINKWSEIVNDWNGGERKPLELFYNWLTDAVKSMNEGDGE